MAQWRARIDIPARIDGPAPARHVAVELVRVWGLAELEADVALVVSELVTNAYRHAPGTDSFEISRCIVREGCGCRWLTARRSAPVSGRCGATRRVVGGSRLSGRPRLGGASRTIMAVSASGLISTVGEYPGGRRHVPVVLHH